MAKSSSFFGLRTGSTKSLTFQVLRGQQITKDRVTKIANPRTMAQMEQRAKLPIVAAARSALKGLVDHSWEGVAYGDASLREFSRVNLTKDALQVTSFASPSAPSPGIAQFHVSRGSLVGFSSEVSDMKRVFSRSAAFGEAKVFPKMETGTKGSTIIYYLMKYLSDNKMNTLDAGEQLTFLTLNIVSHQETDKVNVPITGFEVCRLIMPDVTKISADNLPTYTDDNDFFSLENAVPEGGSSSVTLKHGENLRVTITAGPDKLSLSCANEDRTTVGCALIESKLINNVWKRSTSDIKIVTDLVGPDILTFTEWAEYFAPATAKSVKYLNKGSEPTGINS